jgi:hypothetical protein
VYSRARSARRSDCRVFLRSSRSLSFRNVTTSTDLPFILGHALLRVVPRRARSHPDAPLAFVRLLAACVHLVPRVKRKANAGCSAAKKSLSRAQLQADNIAT